jgi:hypothetical protein
MTLFEIPAKKKIDPAEDGITHINIYSKGTSLGRFLSNFAPYKIPYHGVVLGSVEALWYYLKVADRAEPQDLKELIPLSESAAKKKGKELVEKYGEDHVDNFMEIIEWAIRYKIDTAPPKIREEFFSSTLPFEHYYVMYGKYIHAGHEWLIDLMDTIRKEGQ